MHVPIMVGEIIERLKAIDPKQIIDATLGEGGHTEAMLKTFPNCRVLAIEQDARNIQRARRRLGGFLSRVSIAHTTYNNIDSACYENGLHSVDAILFDLGVSSSQIEDRETGLSFSSNGPLDMRLCHDRGAHPANEISAKDLLNTKTSPELEELFFTLDIPFAKKLVAQIISDRSSKPFAVTSDLVETIDRAGIKRKRNHHPATLVFQALRIAVNHELDHLSQALPKTPALVRRGGLLMVMSFHSLEDRIVKHYLQRESRDCICPPTVPLCQCNHRAQWKRSPASAMTPQPDEIRSNPRSRSAKLRIATRL